VNYSPLVLGGSNDVEIQPGYVDVAANGREVVFRLAETLPDDRYRIDILGAGDAPLRDEDGLPFNRGRNQSTEFRLDLAPRVEAGVPAAVRLTGPAGLERTGDRMPV